MQATETTNKTVLPSQEEDAVQLRDVFFQILSNKQWKPATKDIKIADALLSALIGRGRFFFHEDIRDFKNAMFFDSKRKLLLWIDSDEFKSWVSSYAGINRATKLFGFCYSAIQNETLSGRTSGIIPSQYWAGKDGCIYLSNGRGGMVKISATEILPCDNGTDGVLFASGFTLAPWKLVEPSDPFEACSLWRDASYAQNHGKDLLRAWTISLPTSQRCKPPLATTGPIGSGKSRTIYGLFDLFGMAPRISAVTEGGEDNFWNSMNHGGLCCFDNVDTRTKWLPDALAAAATDGSTEKRRLYTDHDQVRLHARAWLAVTSANPTFAADAAVADRLLVVRLNTRPVGTTSESVLTDEILSIRDAGMSFIAGALQRAIADTNPAQAVNRRHPDFSTMAVKIGRAIGREQQVISALQSAEADKSLFNLENDTIGSAILDYFNSDDTGLTTSFVGTAKELLEAISSTDDFIHDNWSPKKLSKSIARIWPHLQVHMNATSERIHGGFVRYSLRKPIAEAV